MSNIPSAVILLQEEPLDAILGKWLGWMMVMVLFMVSLIYFSNYFARGTECFIDSPYPVEYINRDVKNNNWRRRFLPAEDHRTYV